MATINTIYSTFLVSNKLFALITTLTHPVDLLGWNQSPVPLRYKNILCTNFCPLYEHKGALTLVRFVQTSEEQLSVAASACEPLKDLMAALFSIIMLSVDQHLSSIGGLDPST